MHKLIASLIVLAATQAVAQPTFTTIDNPADPTFNQLLGINDKGEISGYFGSTQVGHPNQAYTIAPPYTTFVPANMPASVQTQATGLNNAGTITGFWSPTNLGGGDANYGFIRWVNKAGQYRYLNVNDPLVASTPPVNQVLGINKSEIAVGFYNDANNLPHGFAFTVKTGQYTPVNVTGAVSDSANGVNNRGLVCGSFTTAMGRTVGFLESLTPGSSAIHFGVPHSANTQFLGVNDTGIAVGLFMDKQNVPHGVIYNPTSGNWLQVDAPSGIMGTTLNGINNKGEIVGFYTDAANNTHGLLLTGEVMP